MGRVLNFCSGLVGLLAILLGLLLFTPYPKQLGLYRLHSRTSPEAVGLSPAHLYGVEWNFSFEDLKALPSLEGQNAVVTGANAGIGYATALWLAKKNAKTVTLTCRSAAKCDNAVERIKKEIAESGSTTSTDLLTAHLDVSSMTSTKAFAEKYLAGLKKPSSDDDGDGEGNDDTGNADTDDALDMLFLNAGFAYFAPGERCVPMSEDDVELVFATNYLNHHLLYRWLEPALQRAKVGRVVSTSSGSSYKTYDFKVATNHELLNGCTVPFMGRPENLSYGQSKLAQIVWSKALTDRLGPDSSIFVNAYHPGLVNTSIFDKFRVMMKMSQWFSDLVQWMQDNIMWTSEEGALTGLYLGVHVEKLKTDNIRGAYYHPQSIPMINPLAEDKKLQTDLWDFSEELVKDFLPPVVE